MCEEGENLPSQSSIILSAGNRKAIHLDLLEMKQKSGYTHIVVYTPVHMDNTVVNTDVYNPRDRRISYYLLRWINFWRTSTVVEKTVPGAAFYNLSLIGMEYPCQAYMVNVESDNCVNQNGKSEPGVAMFITPWANIAGTC